MKIVLVSKEFPPSPYSYGIGTYTEETSLSIARLGHEVTVICASDEATPASESFHDGVRVIRLQDDEGAAVGFRSKLTESSEALEYRKRVAETLERLIDSGHAEIVEFPGYRGESYLWRTGRRAPMVVRMHGLVGWINKKWTDQWIPRRSQQVKFETAELLDADCVTLPADHVRGFVERRIPKEKVITLPNGIDGHRWLQLSLQGVASHLSCEDILYVGSLTQRKGVFNLIEAASQLHRDDKWSGRLVLQGAATNEFDRYCVRRWGSRRAVPPFVSIRASVARRSLAPYYRQAAVCCFPSWSETFGYAAMEAAVCGGLVVGSADTGISEFIVDRETGFLVKPGDSKELAAVLKRALSLPRSERERIIDAAQQKVLREFDQDALTRRLIGIYEQQICKFALQNERRLTDKIREMSYSG
jgi:glycosyltransferase involved in cell wall biosynthesis